MLFCFIDKADVKYKFLSLPYPILAWAPKIISIPCAPNTNLVGLNVLPFISTSIQDNTY